jgi:hypothetical protein
VEAVISGLSTNDISSLLRKLPRTAILAQKYITIAVKTGIIRINKDLNDFKKENKFPSDLKMNSIKIITGRITTAFSFVNIASNVKIKRKTACKYFLLPSAFIAVRIAKQENIVLIVSLLPNAGTTVSV